MTPVFQRLGILGLGAGLMYLLDPDRGHRRRVFLRDQVTHTGHLFRREFVRASRDLSNRVCGLTAMGTEFLGVKCTDDDILAARVRSSIGRVTSHPGAIDIHAKDGHVRLQGPILANEMGGVLAKVQSTPGVRQVENLLDVHEQPDDVPALQPPGRTRNTPSRVAWKPANRLLSGLAAGGLIIYGVRYSGFAGVTAKLAGLGIFARAISNHTLGSLVGIDGRCEVAIQKTVTIHAPVETVFLFLSNYSNFPHFMSHLEEVRDLGSNRSHWVASGTGGVHVEWNARTTELITNRSLAWQSEAGARIEHTGNMRFESAGDNSTRVTLHMSYKPPVGLLGHAVATILGVDPKRQMDEDFVRMKSLIELGKTTAHRKPVTRQEVENLMAGAAAGD